MLVISVSDHGPGFSPEMLERFGRPHQSSKGAGHGVRLFVAAHDGEAARPSRDQELAGARPLHASRARARG